MVGMINDAFGPRQHERNKYVEKFEELMEEAKKPVYEGCKKYSKLSFIVRAFQIKCLNKWSNKSFSEMLELIHDLSRFVA